MPPTVRLERSVVFTYALRPSLRNISVAQDNLASFSGIKKRFRRLGMRKEQCEKENVRVNQYPRRCFHSGLRLQAPARHLRWTRR